MTRNDLVKFIQATVINGTANNRRKTCKINKRPSITVRTATLRWIGCNKYWFFLSFHPPRRAVRKNFFREISLPRTQLSLPLSLCIPSFFSLSFFFFSLSLRCNSFSRGKDWCKESEADVISWKFETVVFKKFDPASREKKIWLE